MFRTIHNFFSGAAAASSDFPLTQLDCPNPTPANSPRGIFSCTTEYLAPQKDALGTKIDVNALFRSAFRVAGDAKEKYSEQLERAVFPVFCRKTQRVVEKVFLIHPDTFDPDSQDAATRPAIQIVDKRVKLDHQHKPKMYVVLTPKNPDLSMSQFQPSRLGILEEASVLGLSPKKKSIVQVESSPLSEDHPLHHEKKDILLLEFINGGDLLNFRYDHLALEDFKKIDLMTQAIRLIVKLHEKKIAHRDLKPENFLVRIRDEDHFELKIADFGFSLKTEELTRERCYSPGYMDPQFLQSYFIGARFHVGSEEPVDDEKPICPFSQDCWSLGATLFFILFGEGYEKTLRQNVRKGHMPLANLDDFIDAKEKISDEILKSMCMSFSREVYDVLSGLLQYRPEKRISAQQALAILEGAKTEPPVGM